MLPFLWGQNNMIPYTPVAIVPAVLTAFLTPGIARDYPRGWCIMGGGDIFILFPGFPRFLHLPTSVIFNKNFQLPKSERYSGFHAQIEYRII